MGDPGKEYKSTRRGNWSREGYGSALGGVGVNMVGGRVSLGECRCQPGRG